MYGDIKIYDLKKSVVTGAVVIDGFPSVGLVSSIVANYLINALELEQIGIIDSVKFPTISLVHDGVPYNPVRIYAGKSSESKEDLNQIVVFISEFQPPQSMIRPITTTILDWMQEHKCKLLISPEGFVSGEPGEGGTAMITDDDEETEEEPPIAFGIGSTPNTNSLLNKYDISIFADGVISGVSGVLLNEAKRREIDVICLLAEAHAEYPDARAAAQIIETIDKMLLKIEIDAQPLYEQAQKIEKHIQKAQIASKDKVVKSTPLYGYG